MIAMTFNAMLIAIREIRRNLMRSFLTVIGIVIGVAAVITMVTLGQGATEMVKQQISKMGNNLLVLRPGQGWGGGGAPMFSMEDVDAIRDQVPGVAAAGWGGGVEGGLHFRGRISMKKIFVLAVLCAWAVQAGTVSLKPGTKIASPVEARDAARKMERPVTTCCLKSSDTREDWLGAAGEGR